MSVHVTHGLQKAMLSQLANDNPPGDHTQISSQRTSTSKTSESSHVANQKFSEGVGAKIFHVVGVQFQAVSLRRVVDDLQDQACIPINKQFPRSALSGEQVTQQLAIDVSEWHGYGPI